MLLVGQQAANLSNQAEQLEGLLRKQLETLTLDETSNNLEALGDILTAVWLMLGLLQARTESLREAVAIEGDGNRERRLALESALFNFRHGRDCLMAAWHLVNTAKGEIRSADQHKPVAQVADAEMALSRQTTPR